MEKTVNGHKRNSLFEFYRFLFALNVVIGHGFFPIDIGHFGPDRISVEFFFVLSGFLFFHSLQAYKNMSMGAAVKVMLISKTKRIYIPMIIGIISNIILNYITNYNPLKVFRYLWYIPAMLAVFLMYTLLRVVIQNDNLFLTVVFAVFVIATVLRFSGPEELFFFDLVRSASAISLGILIAKIPKFKINSKCLWVLMLIPVAVSAFFIIYWSLAENSRIYEAILDLILYPLLIYITSNINLHSRFFNYLGDLSFGIYAYQCPARLIANLGVGNSWIPFSLIFVFALADDIIKRIIRRKNTVRVHGK